MARAAVTSETIDYPSSDGLPMAESEFQFWPILYAGSALAHHYRARDDVYVVGNLLLYYEKAMPGQAARSVSPDLMVVIGAPKHLRPSYLLWEEPKAPDFVLEMASRSTHRSDRQDKPAVYARIGVSEYWLYDPVGEYLEPRLQGLRLQGDRYEPIPVAVRENGVLSGLSEALGLELRLYPGDRFRFHDPVSGQDLRSLDEAEARLEQADAAWQRETRAREEAEAARQALEARLRDLQRRPDDRA